MEYLYIFVSLTFVLTLIGMKKSDNKLNLLTWITVSLVTLFSLNMFLTFLLHFIHVKSSYLILSLIYLILSFIIFYFKICNKNIMGKKTFQKYNISLGNIIYALLLIVICIAIGIIRFNKFTTISYNTVDPSVHHRIALKYSQIHDLMDSTNSKDELFKNFSYSMTGSYVNGGIFINIFSFLPTYLSFIIYNIYTFTLATLIFFVLGLEISNFKHKFIIFLMTCLYIFGYPLCEYLFGFYYLGIGVMFISLIVLFFTLVQKKIICINEKYTIILLFLLNYSLYFSYYLFMPFVYFAEGVYFIINICRKKWNLKQTIKFSILSLILPFIIGTCYFILPGFFSSASSDISSITSEGAIYRCFISNFYIFIPLIIYCIINHIRKKNFCFELIILLTFSIGLLLILVLGLKGLISSYYYYKFYFVLWLLFFVFIIKILSFKEKMNVTLIYSWLIFLLFIFSIAIFNLEDKVKNKNALYNSSRTTTVLLDVYSYNFFYLSNSITIFDKSQLELINNSERYFKECHIIKNELFMLGNYNQKFWFYSIYGIVPTYNHKPKLDSLYDESNKYKDWKDDSSSKCAIIFNNLNDENSKDYIDLNSDDYKILFKNGSGAIIKKK